LQRARWLPLEFVAEFEARFVRARDSETISFRRQKARAQNIWRAVRRVISTVDAEPGQWLYHTYDIYNYFLRKNLSVKYINTIFTTKICGVLKTLIVGNWFFGCTRKKLLHCRQKIVGSRFRFFFPNRCFRWNKKLKTSAYEWGTQQLTELGAVTKTKKDFI
jgi:hypothetical protein